MNYAHKHKICIKAVPGAGDATQWWCVWVQSPALKTTKSSSHSSFDAMPIIIRRSVLRALTCTAVSFQIFNVQ